MTSDARPPLGLRGGLRRLSTGLIAYGVIGLVIAVIGLAAVWWVGGRIDNAATRLDTTVTNLTASIDRTSEALTDASATAQSFAVTISRTSSSVEQAADAIRGIRPQLLALETQFRSFNILGNAPLTRAADLVGQIASDLDGFDQRLDVLAASLLENRDRLLENAESLGALGTSLATIGDRLESGIIEESMDDLRAVVMVILLLLVVWTAVPAAGALLFGAWLRSELTRGAGAASA